MFTKAFTDTVYAGIASHMYIMLFSQQVDVAAVKNWLYSNNISENIKILNRCLGILWYCSTKSRHTVDMLAYTWGKARMHKVSVHFLHGIFFVLEHANRQDSKVNKAQRGHNP